MSDTATPIDMSATWARIARQERDRETLNRELMPSNKAAIFDAAAAVGITSIVVQFDGSGDSGQIESVDGFRGEQAAELPTIDIELATPNHDGSDVHRRVAAFPDAVESLLYALLEDTHGGWENNEGAYGEFTLDVADRTIELDFNMRIETAEHFGHSW